MKTKVFAQALIRAVRCILVVAALYVGGAAQGVEREIPLQAGATVEVLNYYGRVSVASEDSEKISITAPEALGREVVSLFRNGKFIVRIEPSSEGKRIDVSLTIPLRSKLRIETRDGEARVEGDVSSADIRTDSGTIAAQVPLDDLEYRFLWLTSRPRVLSDIPLEEAKEKSAGRFVIKGRASERGNGPLESGSDRKSTRLNLTTGRGIILLNVDPEAVPSDLRERPLTDAAKAIVRSGDSLLVNAIRRASPRHFAAYLQSIPAYERPPAFSAQSSRPEPVNFEIKRVLVKVTDQDNRAINGLTREDFVLSERGDENEVMEVVSAQTPFNLVLLLDVSGSVDEYVDFIRKAARSFVDTVNAEDRIAIVIFNEDVKLLSGFSTDKAMLSAALDTFDAGGGTAYYDALGYVLSQTLDPLKGERTAIVALSDGDDTKSFLPFDALIGSIQESGALIYPLYVPSELIAASSSNDPGKSADPLRTRYMGLTSKADAEGRELARISGGIYYPIKRSGEIQEAYDDIVRQLRTAYSITFRSEYKPRPGQSAPRVKVRVKRNDAFVKVGSVVGIGQEIPARD